VLLALSWGQKGGLIAVAAVFIGFALICSFVLPRRWPDFPGRGLRPFLVVVVVLTLGMLGTVIALASEPKETEHAEAAAPAGDPAKGKALFAAQGCSSCHTFKPAGAHGTVGPDLDHVAADAEKANRGSLDEYVHESIADPNAYVVPGFPKGTMPSFSTLKPEEVDDLVAFVTGGEK
jgi:mono/diheme cytochrome c family protein